MSLAWKEWPFPVNPEEEWNEFDRDFVAFLEQARAAGRRPRFNMRNAIQAGSFGEGSRGVWLIFRGRRNGWEVSLYTDEQEEPLGPRYGLPGHACVCVRPPFRDAGRLALAWMQGEDLDVILDGFEFVGGSPPGLVSKPAAAEF